MIKEAFAQWWQKRQDDGLGPRETVYGYDYDPESDDGGIWMGTIPLAVINDHGSADCRMTYDLFIARRNGSIAFAILGALVLAGLSYKVPGVGANGAIMGLFIGAMLGTFGGWFISHRFAPKPISLYRRVWNLCTAEEAGVGSDGSLPDPPVHPETGMQVRETKAGYWRLECYPLKYTNLRGEDAMDEPVVVSGDVSIVGTEDKDQPQDDFAPEMLRASTQWEVLQQRIDKLRWRRHLVSTWERVQLGGAVAIAAAVVVLAAFLIISGTDPRG